MSGDVSANSTATVKNRRIAIGYVLVAALLAGAATFSLIVGSSKPAPPRFAGTYTSASACLGRGKQPFSIVQSGQYVEFKGGPSGSFRLHDRRLRGSVRCRNGSTARIALREGTTGHPEPIGTVRGRPADLSVPMVSAAAATPRNDEDTIGRLLLAMAVIVVAARLLGSAVTKIGQPRVMGEVLAGVLLGATLLGTVWPSAQHYVFPADIVPLLKAIANVGLVFYLFMVGMEFDPGSLRGRATQAAFISNASVAVPLALGFLAAIPLYEFLGPPGSRYGAFALFIAVSMSVTAFPVLARILVERRMLKRPVGALSLASAAIDDVTAWGLLALALAVAGKGSGFHALEVLGWTALFVVVMLVATKPFLGRAATAYAEVGQLPLIWIGTIFVGVLLASFTSERAGVAPLFGAFIMGSVMPRNAGLTADVSRRIDDFVMILLLPLFFAVSGLRVDLTGIDDGILWLTTFGLIAIAIVGKWGAGMLAARLTGMSRREASAVGALLNTRGLTELIVLNIALDAGAITPKLFSMLVLMALVTTFMTGPALRLIDPRKELTSPAEEELEDEAEPAAAARLHSIVVAPQDDRNLEALLTIAEPLARSQPSRELVIVEALRPAYLVAGRVRDRDDVSQANRRLDAQRQLLLHNGVTARVAAFTSTDPGRDYLRLGSRERVDLVLVDGRRPLLRGGVPRGAVGHLLDRAPCDVAVLVERSDRPPIDRSHPVAVPFGGAPHDWAALELGTWIAASRGVPLRLIGAAGSESEGDSSRVLGNASMVVQSFSGVSVEPVVAGKGRSGILEAMRGAGLLVVGLSSDWRREGLGTLRSTIATTLDAPVLFVRRGTRPGVLAPEGSDVTRFSWSSVGSSIGTGASSVGLDTPPAPS